MNSFIRSVFTLASGTAIAQVLVILTAPILTRLYNPRDFGILANYNALLEIILVCSMLRYEMIISLQKSQSARNLNIATCLIFLTIATLICFTVVSLNSEVIVRHYAIEDNINIFLFLPISLFVSGIFYILHYTHISNNEFKVIRNNMIIQPCANVGMQLSFYKLEIIGLLFSQILSKIFAVYYYLKIINFTTFKYTKLKKTLIYHFIKMNWRIPVFTLPSNFLNTINSQVVPIYLVAIFDASSAGLYFLTMKVISGPVKLIGSALGSVFLSRVGKESDEEVNLLINKIVLYTATMCIVPMVIFTLHSPSIFTFIFGDVWAKSGSLIVLVLPWILLQFQWSPISHIMNARGYQSNLFIIQIVSSILRLGSLLTAWFLQLDFLSTVLLYSVASATSYLIRLYWLFIKLKLSILFITMLNTFLIGGNIFWTFLH